MIFIQPKLGGRFHPRDTIRNLGGDFVRFGGEIFIYFWLVLVQLQIDDLFGGWDFSHEFWGHDPSKGRILATRICDQTHRTAFKSQFSSKLVGPNLCRVGPLKKLMSSSWKSFESGSSTSRLRSRGDDGSGWANLSWYPDAAEPRWLRLARKATMAGISASHLAWDAYRIEILKYLELDLDMCNYRVWTCGLARYFLFFLRSQGFLGCSVGWWCSVQLRWHSGDTLERWRGREKGRRLQWWDLSAAWIFFIKNAHLKW